MKVTIELTHGEIAACVAKHLRERGAEVDAQQIQFLCEATEACRGMSIGISVRVDAELVEPSELAARIREHLNSEKNR